MTIDEELQLAEARIGDKLVNIWHRGELEADEICADLEHVRITTVTLVCVVEKRVEPGANTYHLRGVVAAAHASVTQEQLDRIYQHAAGGCDRQEVYDVGGRMHS